MVSYTDAAAKIMKILKDVPADDAQTILMFVEKCVFAASVKSAVPRDADHGDEMPQ